MLARRAHGRNDGDLHVDAGLDDFAFLDEQVDAVADYCGSELLNEFRDALSVDFLQNGFHFAFWVYVCDSGLHYLYFWLSDRLRRRDYLSVDVADVDRVEVDENDPSEATPAQDLRAEAAYRAHAYLQHSRALHVLQRLLALSEDKPLEYLFLCEHW